MQLDSIRYLVVEGPIGVGKTTLAKRFAQRLQAQLLLEMPEENPFLARFYQDSARYAFHTQMFFLFQRVHQLRTLAQHDLFEHHVVSDFLLDKDPLFARLTLADDELALYLNMYRQFAPHAVAPDLVVCLHAEPDTLVERVRKRGHLIERNISENYLRRLSDSYTRFFHSYDGAPVLIVNTEHLNPVERDEDFDLLLQRIEQMKSKREFFNLAGRN